MGEIEREVSHSQTIEMVRDYREVKAEYRQRDRTGSMGFIRGRLVEDFAVSGMRPHCSTQTKNMILLDTRTQVTVIPGNHPKFLQRGPLTYKELPVKQTKKVYKYNLM